MPTLATLARAMGSFAMGLMVLGVAPASAQEEEGAPSEAASAASDVDADAALGPVTVPPGYESGAALAAPTPPRSETDTERPPSFGGRPPEPPAPLPPLDGHTLPIRLADRPLTLTEGTGRIDHGIMLQTAGGILARMNVGATLGVTEDLEIGVSWPIEGDPTIQATGRLFHEGPFELGLRGAVMIPAITTGNTNARVGMPFVLRGGPVRFFAVPTVDLLFTANVSVLLALPAQLSITAGRVFSFGAQGWIGLVDGRVAQGDVFGFVNFTAYAGRRAIMDARIAMGYAPAEGHLIFTTSLSFYPQLY